MNIDPVELAPKAAQAESFLKALANRHRLMVLCELHKGEHSVTKLQEAIGLSQSSLSQHLARLRRDHVVTTRRVAQTIYYSLAGPEARSIIVTLYNLYCGADADDFTSKTMPLVDAGPSKVTSASAG